jgi:nitrate/nitrite transporter NarK
MSVLLGNPLVLFADYIVPLIIAYVFSLVWGPNRGALFGVVPALLAIFVLFFLQVSPGVNPDGSTRFDSAFGYMMSEAIFWSSSFLVGVAFGSVHHRLRGRRG